MARRASRSGRSEAGQLARRLLAVASASCLAACASNGTQAPANAPAPTATPASSSAPPVAASPPGPTAGDRADAAINGFVVGALIGFVGGPIGAAAVGTTLAVYGAVTGNTPFGGGSGGGYY